MISRLKAIPSSCRGGMSPPIAKPWNPNYPEGSYLRTRALNDCFRCHDGKTEYQGRVLDRKCETCHLPDKIGDFLFN